MKNFVVWSRPLVSWAGWQTWSGRLVKLLFGKRQYATESIPATVAHISFTTENGDTRDSHRPFVHAYIFEFAERSAKTGLTHFNEMNAKKKNNGIVDYTRTLSAIAIVIMKALLFFATLKCRFLAFFALPSISI